MRSVVFGIVLLTVTLMGCSHSQSGGGNAVDHLVLEDRAAVAVIPAPPGPEVMDVSRYLDDPLWEGPSYGRQFVTLDEKTGARVEVFPDDSFIATLPGKQGTFGRRKLSNEMMVHAAVAAEAIGRGIQLAGFSPAEPSTVGAMPLLWQVWHYWDDRKIGEGRREWLVEIPQGN